MEYEAFKQHVLRLPGVVGMSGPSSCVVFVETDQHAIILRQMIHPSIAVSVTGVLWQEIPSPAPKAPSTEAMTSGSA